ncbi:hypothetical protein [Haematobacter genomosp. 1]|uniref:Uncharacterized protein n=1 Tax=Haematobacter genomosp. 1 TaxID=366618 RepID=A0A212AAR2_9RHOB|nr:hypothetical protein [Haematobacter genomosp. 1]OWJ77418.1 hypothetical protein CDV49_11335 [Haematobacter genomosp. 1]
MARLRTAAVETVEGDYNFIIYLTEIEAFKTLNARPGETVKLSGENEAITIGRHGEATHRKNVRGSETTYDHVKVSSLHEVLNKMIADRVWDEPCEFDEDEDEE